MYARILRIRIRRSRMGGLYSIVHRSPVRVVAQPAGLKVHRIPFVSDDYGNEGNDHREYQYDGNDGCSGLSASLLFVPLAMGCIIIGMHVVNYIDVPECFQG